jgi:hypothetical protein
MNKIYAILTAVALGLATAGQSFAFTKADTDALQALTTDGNPNDAAQIEAYAAEKSEAIVIYEGEKAQKADAGMTIFAGSPFPAPVGTVIFGAVDPEDDTVLVALFDAQGTFIGAGWFAKTTIDAVKDYVEAGI